jgi:hypothetical protein
MFGATQRSQGAPEKVCHPAPKKKHPTVLQRAPFAQAMPDAQQKAKKAWGNVKSNVKSGAAAGGGSKKESWDRLTPARELLTHLGESTLLGK